MGDKKIWNQAIPHIGIGYIAAVLEQNGHHVEILDFPSMDLTIDDILRYLEKKQYGAIGISLYFYNKFNAKKMVRKIKRRSDAFLFMGGYYPTLSMDKTFELFPEADCVIIGEGEITTNELIERLEKKEDWHSIQGIAYMQDGKIMKTEPRALITDLDSLPFPKRPENINMKYLPIVSSRGCYGRCSFCGVMEFYMCNAGKRRRFRSADNVVQEIKALVVESHTECIIVNDETFFDASKNRKEWLEQFIEKISSLNIKVDFQCQARANDVIYNYPLIETMVQRGMTRLFVGLESFTQRQLDFYQKDLNVDTNIQAVKLLHNLNTQMFFGFIFFDPLITLDEIETNIERIRSIELCAIASPEEQRPFSMSILLVIEGTKIYDVVHEMNFESDNERGYVFQHSEVEYMHSLLQDWHKQLVVVCDNMFCIFYVRKKDPDRYTQLVSLKRKFLELDLKYMEFLCKMIRNETDEKTIKENSIPYFERLKEITEQMMEIFEQTPFSIE
jgi:radical SAM superfamily enzyme YgiQ (UPF0313 family)